MSDEMILRHCSPTLAGMKTGSLFSCKFVSKELLKQEIRKLNGRFSGKGVRILPLAMGERRALIYVYRPARLQKDLACGGVSLFLEKYGYPWQKPGQCIARLVLRLQESSEFPHEIGLFLGYPLEDVRGFMENHAQKEKCTGCWKVYGDEKKARRLFALYKACTRECIRQFTKGSTIEQLTAAV